MKRNVTAVLFLSVFPYGVFGHDEDAPIATAVDMKAWCKEVTYAHLAAGATKVTNWAHSVVAKGNSYIVKGRWRVDGERVEVECRARIGSQRKYASFVVVESE